MAPMRYGALVLAVVGALSSEPIRRAPALAAIDRAVAASIRPAIVAAITVPVAPSTFRSESPDFNPERYVFDSVVDGHALRVLVYGMPMYCVDQ
jgi:hypothetical protein